MTLHISDPYIASVLDTINVSTRGIDIKELRAAHPADEDDSPSHLSDALNELRRRGAIEIRNARYFPATSQPLAAAPTPAPTTKEAPMPKQKLNVRDTVRSALANGPASADQLAEFTGLTRKQCIDTCVQLTIKGEFAIDKKGIGGAATTYRVTAITPRKPKAGKRKYTKRTTPAPTAIIARAHDSLGNVSATTARAHHMPTNPNDAHLVGLQANGDAIVVDKLAGSFQVIAAAAVQQLLAFSHARQSA